MDLALLASPFIACIVISVIFKIAGVKDIPPFTGRSHRGI
jgi:hypothetical protein